MPATEQDILHLDTLYAGRQPFHGELHDHADTGGTSDGKRTLAHWTGALEALKMDFAAILDHKQVRHMYLPEWQDGLFICGTEPGTIIDDSNATDKSVHYNMIFDSPEPLEDLLAAFPEYGFTGGPEGHFNYPHFTRARFGELIDAVRARGGFFVHPHPKQQMQADDPLEYWFRDETGLEVFYRSITSRHTEKNYILWTDLLAAGKRVWACAGGYGHKFCEDTALTTLYAEAHADAAYLPHLRVGDFTCGPVGMRMCVGDTRMGGRCALAGQRLVLGVSDFHRTVKITDHEYRVDILTDKGVVHSQPISCEEPNYIAFDTEDAAFYRAEVFDVSRDLRIAIGNPIWNV